MNYSQSKENLLINNITNVKLINKALGSKKAFVRTKMHNNHSRGCIYTEIVDDNFGIEQIKLDSLELDNIDYIKIDVEGNELDVLKGAIDTIIKNKPIIELEYNNLSKRFNVELNDIIIFLKKLNYKFDKRFESNLYFICDVSQESH